MRSLARLSAITLLALALTAPTLTDAKPMRMIGGGVSTDLGYRQNNGYKGPGDAGMVSEIDVRMDFLYVFGLELSYNMGSFDTIKEDSGLVYDARFRLSGILYAVPTEVVSMYLKAGVGARNMAELGGFDNKGNSYHGGFGLEWYLADHFALTSEFLVLIPGSHSVERVVNNQFGEAQSAFGQTYSSLKPQQATRAAPGDTTLGDFVSLENFQTTVGFRMTF